MKWYAVLDENDVVVDVRVFDVTNPNEDFTGVVAINSLPNEDRSLIGKWFNGQTLQYEDVQ